ncbi:hypothetical protein KY289_013533 [Solanum tuberosum]|nr:hypothetical protein KY289_013533 [Solanum tuberosum]
MKVKVSFHLMNTLLKCKCVEGKTGNKIKVSELRVKHEQMKHELEEMKVTLANRDVEIAHLNAQLLKAKS